MLRASAAFDFYAGDRWRSEYVESTLVSIKDNRVTLCVGESSIPIKLPKVILTDISEFFSGGFGMSSAFAEAISTEMRLPQEDPKDIIFLLRLLIEGSDRLGDMKRPHWPYKEEEEDALGRRHRHSFPEKQSSLFRFLAMVDRLGFNAAKEPFRSLFPEFSAGILANPLAPPFVDWSMENVCDNGCLQPYVAIWLALLVDYRVTILWTYEAQLLGFHAIFLLMYDARRADGRYGSAWDQTEDVWKAAGSSQGTLEEPGSHSR